MSIFLSVVACCVVFSWFRAKELGVPWFSWGGARPISARPTADAYSHWKRPGKANAARRYKAEKAAGKQQKRHPTKAERELQRQASAAERMVIGRLHSLTRNEEVSDRLIGHVQERNPEKDRVWCIEKAIYDIERDRMA